MNRSSLMVKKIGEHKLPCRGDLGSYRIEHVLHHATKAHQCAWCVAFCVGCVDERHLGKPISVSPNEPASRDSCQLLLSKSQQTYLIKCRGVLQGGSHGVRNAPVTVGVKPVAFSGCHEKLIDHGKRLQGCGVHHSVCELKGFAPISL